MSDRLRDLIDLVVGSLDDPASDGRALATRAHFSRDHLDRLLAAATGETPVALRRRLLLERAAWQLRHTDAPAGAVAAAAGYGSLPAFSRAFARAYGVPPSAFAGSDQEVALPAPNGIRFHAPAGLLVPGETRRGPDVTGRLLGHHLDRTRSLLALAEDTPADDLDRELRPGLVVLVFEGPEPTARLMAERLVATLEMWVAAMAGEDFPPRADGERLGRWDHVAPRFRRIVARLATSGAWDDAFVDALCEPPQSFTYGGVVAHVLTFGVVRREALAGCLAELGAPEPEVPADPILWEMTAYRNSGRSAS